ncbi:MAG: hypothetical protein GWN58_66120, partial [Anaerolineae bacterium]|nr:hypothetical protein [Anaerolineae bacterium]
SDLDRYIAHSRVSMIRAADQHMDYDVLALGLVHVRRQPVLGGEAWTAMVIFLEYADRESMMAWAENGATDYELRRGTIGHYGASPFEAPKYHHECLRRPSNEGLPPWEALEAEAK